MMEKVVLPMRTVQELFDKLASICISPGYVHAISYLCLRDTMISYSGEMKTEDMQHLYSGKQLIRTEISVLIGLMIKHDIDYNIPTPQILEEYVETTDSLLVQIHDAMSASISDGLDPKKLADKDFNPFTSGAVLREPIFYGAESAYGFQYRDFSTAKYGRDDQWLVENKGFSIQAARNVVYAISRLRDEKSGPMLQALRKALENAGMFLPGNTFTAQEIADYAHMDLAIVERILVAFAVPQSARNEQFKALLDFNISNAHPLIFTPDGKYLLFHICSLAEALYEAPFYWMIDDKNYVSTAMRNRGLFTEQFAAKRLSQVFGEKNVLSNIDIFESKGTKLGEIDVLVLFGNRALILQAKSKRLTLEARSGNDLKIRDDFKKSIQDSSDQAYHCAQLMEDGKCLFKDASGNIVSLPRDLKRIYILCLISDHYPALSFQVLQFLKYTPTAKISPPFVMNVFTLDAMTEMLSSPLHLLSYVDRRTGYPDKILASDELTVLSHHLKQNLWLDDEYIMLNLHDDISADLDKAMLVRREGIPGKDTPDGILTWFPATTLGRMLKAIEARSDPAIVDLGFMLLTLSEDTVNDISAIIDLITERAIADGKNHSTHGTDRGRTGLTIHCNDDLIEIARPRLQNHCYARKYTEHAQTWFGVCLRPRDQALRFGINLDFPWEQSDAMDLRTKAMEKPSK
ncbi:nuclease-related domain-containing protein [Verminephrobacter aporrectodeae]|uniref:nuclease-related domain-containing protein n=1 Tax=Verminephrobacter aporrectodeae TaxID=1110389 RepID=UPI00030A532C|nr:nuclease-related domain-containing protein [Verminephrobacter aporrectodeae]